MTKVHIPIALVTKRRAQLGKLTRMELHASYRLLPSREHVGRTLLSDAAIIDIIIWTEYSDRYRLGSRKKS